MIKILLNKMNLSATNSGDQQTLLKAILERFDHLNLISNEMKCRASEHFLILLYRIDRLSVGTTEHAAGSIAFHKTGLEVRQLHILI